MTKTYLFCPELVDWLYATKVPRRTRFTLELRTGDAPMSCKSRDQGKRLVRIPFTIKRRKDISKRVKFEESLVLTTGVARHYRVKDESDVVHVQGEIADTEFAFNSPAFVSSFSRRLK